MKKNAHVVALWGGRREWQSEDYDPEDNLKMLELIIEQEKKLDYGAPTDLILINSVVERPRKGYEKYLELLTEIDGTRIKNGTIRVFHKKNLGISNGAFDFAVVRLIDDYEYWYFSEDDRFTIADGIMSKAIEMIEEKNYGLIATCGMKLAPSRQLYARGSCAVIHCKILKKIMDSPVTDAIDGLKRRNSAYMTRTKGHLYFCTVPEYSRASRRALHWFRATWWFSWAITQPHLGINLPIGIIPCKMSTSNGFPEANRCAVWRWGMIGAMIHYEAFLMLYHPKLHEKYFGHEEYPENYREGIKEWVDWYKGENSFLPNLRRGRALGQRVKPGWKRRHHR